MISNPEAEWEWKGSVYVEDYAGDDPFYHEDGCGFRAVLSPADSGF